MNTSFLPPSWRKSLLLPNPASIPSNRHRRVLRLDRLLAGDRGAFTAPDDEEGGQFDGSWHESSRALARGLVVREWDSADPLKPLSSPLAR
jgi:hypothetical protein